MYQVGKRRIPQVFRHCRAGSRWGTPVTSRSCVVPARRTIGLAGALPTWAISPAELAVRRSLNITERLAAVDLSNTGPSPPGVRAAATRWPTEPDLAVASRQARTRWAAGWSQRQLPSRNRSTSVPSCSAPPAATARTIARSRPLRWSWGSADAALLDTYRDECHGEWLRSGHLPIPLSGSTSGGKYAGWGWCGEALRPRAVAAAVRRSWWEPAADQQEQSEHPAGRWDTAAAVTRRRSCLTTAGHRSALASGMCHVWSPTWCRAAYVGGEGDLGKVSGMMRSYP